MGTDLTDTSSLVGADAKTSTLEAACEPWAFTQSGPLRTGDFIRQARERGVDLDPSLLRELYRHGVLVPFVQIRDRRAGPPVVLVAPQLAAHNTSLYELLQAARLGRLVDPAAVAYRPRMRFDDRHQADVPRWWNGLLYSTYQLLLLTEIGRYIGRATFRWKMGLPVARLPAAHQSLTRLAQRYRTIAAVVTALEARYLPNLDPEWTRISGVDERDLGLWVEYRKNFDPIDLSARFAYAADQARGDAELLLLRAHGIDPVASGPLRQLVRRLPPDGRKYLRGPALVAMDYRVAAEILLRFCEDLAEHGVGSPVPGAATFGISWHPLCDRLSCRDQTLDQDLMDLGLSPHPRVVLAVEGQTEEVHVPLVWKALGYPDAPELVRVLRLGGVDRDLEKVAALAAAPLIRTRLPGHDAWQLAKPPTRLLVAVDPEGRHFETDQKIAKTRAKLLAEIQSVLKAQGVDRPNREELDELIEIKTWSQRCYEFSHFEDAELLDAIFAVDSGRNRRNRAQLLQAIVATRATGKDIKEVWSQWTPKPSKVELALALWPRLEAKIEACKVDEAIPLPEIVEVVQGAYALAQRWRYLSFVLSEEPRSAFAGEPPSVS